MYLGVGGRVQEIVPQRRTLLVGYNLQLHHIQKSRCIDVCRLVNHSFVSTHESNMLEINLPKSTRAGSCRFKLHVCMFCWGRNATTACDKLLGAYSSTAHL